MNDTPTQPPANRPNVVDVTNENFEREVIERSREVPVVVDFWAPWCGPCRTLGPLLESLAAEYAGKFVLAKADTEAVPGIAGAFAVQSIPAVYALRNAKVVDAFVGALPEAEVRAWLDRVIPGPAETLLIQARGLEATDPLAAEALYRESLEATPGEPAAQVGLARVLVALDRLDEASELVHTLEGHGFFTPDVEAVKAEIDLKSHAGGTGGVDAARAEADANPADPALRLKLAEALAASGPKGFEDALGICLALVEDHRKTTGDAARQVMLNIFQILPPDSELAHDYRRKLSAALY